MSIFTYTDQPNHEQGANSVKAHAVDHRCELHKGWPDTSMTVLTAECYAAGCRVGYMVETYRGKVLSDHERNMHDDSDFYAIVVVDEDGEELETTSVTWGTTRGWTYFNNCAVDAPVELRERFEAEKARRAEACRKKLAAERVELDGKTPEVGKRVRVTSKRSKIAHGLEGVVFWFGKSGYARPDYYANPYAGLIDPTRSHPARNLQDYRVGFKTSDGQKHFAAATVFEIVEKKS